MTITNDPTEEVRRNRLAELSGAVESQNPTTERQRLEAQHGQVWDTPELSNGFEVIGFMAPYVVARRKSDGRKGVWSSSTCPGFILTSSSIDLAFVPCRPRPVVAFRLADVGNRQALLIR
jgi:hypothetical protein